MVEAKRLTKSNENTPLLKTVTHARTVKSQLEIDKDEEAKKHALALSCGAMVLVGLGNKTFQKLQTIPMQNYPYLISIMSSMVYVPLCFLYAAIMPMPQEMLEIPKIKFAIMGLCDGFSGIMASFAVNYITNASMIILLNQAAIPISMMISTALLKTSYRSYQYIGACIVVMGILVVLEPSFVGKGGDSGSGQSQVLWSMVLVASTIPSCLSSVYKEKALGETEIDVVYLNGWVSFFQFLVMLPMAIPTASMMNMTLYELYRNTVDGMWCTVGINTVLLPTEGGPNVDNCSMAPFFVPTYVAFNLGYNILLVLILKFGSANILWMAMTVLVPLGNVVFALKFVPGNQPLRSTDIWGLVVIMTGLLAYRFTPQLQDLLSNWWSGGLDHNDKDSSSRGRLRTGYAALEAARSAQRRMLRFVGFGQPVEMMQTHLDSMQNNIRTSLVRTPAQIRSRYFQLLGLPTVATPLSPTSPTHRIAVADSPPSSHRFPSHPSLRRGYSLPNDEMAAAAAAAAKSSNSPFVRVVEEGQLASIPSAAELPGLPAGGGGGGGGGGVQEAAPPPPPAVVRRGYVITPSPVTSPEQQQRSNGRRQDRAHRHDHHRRGNDNNSPATVGGGGGGNRNQRRLSAPNISPVAAAGVGGAQ